MVTKCLTIPMPHSTAKLFVNMIRASLLKGSKNGLYSIPRIMDHIKLQSEAILTSCDTQDLTKDHRTCETIAFERSGMK